IDGDGRAEADRDHLAVAGGRELERGLDGVLVDLVEGRVVGGADGEPALVEGAIAQELGDMLDEDDHTHGASLPRPAAPPATRTPTSGSRALDCCGHFRHRGSMTALTAPSVTLLSTGDATMPATRSERFGVHLV